MLEIQVRKRFVRFQLDIDARSSARVLGLVGPSGCGKTTLLNCLAGVLKPDAGRITQDERELFVSGGASISLPPAQRRIGYVFQDSLLFPHMSVTRNLLYGRREIGTRARFDEVVSILEIGTLLQRHPASLSGGEARRVAIGRALLCEPALLLLDEPLTGLDSRLAGRTLLYLKEILRAVQVPAVYVSHSFSDVMFLCDEVIVLEAGKLAAQGPPRSTFSHVLSGDEELRDLRNVFVANLVRDDLRSVHVVRFADRDLFIASPADPRPGQRLVSIHAADIILANSRPRGISARNALPGRITRIERLTNHELVFVDVGIEWMVEVTSAAVEELDLKPNADVFVIVKASSVSVY